MQIMAATYTFGLGVCVSTEGSAAGSAKVETVIVTIVLDEMDGSKI